MVSPPAYEEAGASAPLDADLTAQFTNLQLHPSPYNIINPDTCLAHLKLLFALQSLKEDIGYTDDLWGIWDNRADGNIAVTDDGEVQEHSYTASHVPSIEDKQRFLSKIREKRWALFVARAVDRYEAWWNSLVGEGPLTESDMDAERSPAYEDFPTAKESDYWETQTLPPLDVLMVFHSHLLNPFNFLEDCMRKGYRRFWQSGMPWILANAAIDGSFNYNISNDDKARWVSQTGRSWANVDDSLVKVLDCPSCNTRLKIPWTTCGLEENPKSAERPGLIGSGYGDGGLDYSCSSCATRITKQILSVAKFCRDSRDLLVRSVPMPGTILEPSTGKPSPWVRTIGQRWNYRTFPNRMIRLVLRIQIQDLIQDFNSDEPPTMETVRKMIEADVLTKQSALSTILEERTGGKSRISRFTPPIAGVCIRKMMSRYWENFGPFALDLIGAVMRQGIFSEKMCKIDWLHSPAAYETMTRLCSKYDRFLGIMHRYPSRVAVPTLDIDLAWHSHMLSPFQYYNFTVPRYTRYFRHDDKIDEDKLGDGFEWTSKTYQEIFGEVYSECTCWYCESVRTSHISSVGKALKLSKNEKVADDFYDSGAAKMCPPDNSAHISSHNAVRAPEEIALATTHAQRVENRLRRIHQRRLEDNYQKASKRAEKKGRKLPPKDQYYNHWGYSYYMYGPWMYPVYFTPGMYCGWDPGYTTSTGADGTGNWANCAAGSCGGSAASGGCAGGGSGGGGCVGGGGGGGG
ncbi:hypothetical protein FZEAL_4063, partial [Fusarium zealandicum]